MEWTVTGIRAVDPNLYDPAAPEPALRGTRCARCDTVFFPPLRWGCEVCGGSGDGLTEESVPTGGVLRSFAVVHLSMHPEVAAPYTIGEIQLDAGPVIRALMTSPDGQGLVIDQRVRAVWHTRKQDAGVDVIEPRFAAEETR
jgi:uncharacterized OB-fold protein